MYLSSWFVSIKMYSYQSSDPFSPPEPTFSVKNVSIRQKSLNISPSDLLYNEIFKVKPPEQRPGYTIHWLRGKSYNNNKANLFESMQNTESQQAKKKHFLTGPYGVIFKGKKLRQRYGVGNIFREAVEFNGKNAVIRNENNMRSKWK